MLNFSGERIVPEASNCEPLFALKMYQEHSARYLFASQAAAGRAVLDVGCGVGYGSQLLAARGAESVTAFDISADAIKHAATYYPHPNLTYSVASAEDFSFSRRFDVVACFELIEHVENQHRVIENIAAALKEDGLLVMSTPRPLDKVRSAFHVRELSLLDFSRILGYRFPFVEWFFENNHFASLVAGAAPKTIEEIYALHPQFELGQADYFVAVASRRAIDRSRFRDQLVLNDDAYVRRLERDVAILRAAEEDLKKKLAEASVPKEVQPAEIPSTEHLDAEIDRLKAGSELLESEIERHKSESGLQAAEILDLKGKLARAKASLQRAQRHYKEDVSSLLSDLARFQAESPLNLHARRELESSQAQVGQWRSAAMVRDEQIKAVCRSRSWRITAPMRSLAALARGGRDVAGTPVGLAALPAEIASPSNGTEAQISGDESVRRLSPLDVLYVIGCHDGESKRYRVHNLVDGLSQLGYSAASVRQDEIPSVIRGRFRANKVVLFRCAFDETIDKLLRYCDENKIETIFDIDDLVFEPESIGLVHVVKTFNDAERALYKDGVEHYRQTLLACDRATCTTPFLAQRIERLGKRADVIPNSLNSEQLAIARALPIKAVRNPKEVRIGYFSGSNTHQVDFESCEPALLVVMDSRPEVRFVLGGLLELAPEWQRFADRIERHPMLPHGELLKVISTIDINLAPLELGNPYAHCKSQLKIFEAGAVKVPTIASATEAYSDAISSGKDGFLASTPEEWLAALEQLIESADLRSSMGERARQRALSQFGAEVVAHRAETVYDLLTGDEQLESSYRNTNSRLRITWIVPKLIIGGGGHRNILRAAYHLEKFGHQLELYFTDSDLNANQLAEAVRTHFYPLQCPMQRYEGAIRPTDVLFATHWTTVSAAMKCRSAAREIIYFVQDFEPAFAPMGTEYILAENTYRLGLYAITSGRWCEEFLKTQFGCEADHFLFPVDRSIYHPRPRSKRGANIVFFAKPEMPRRCFELGVMALEEFHRLRPEVELVLFGSSHLESKPLPLPAPVRSLIRRVGSPNTPNIAPLPFPATVRSLLPGIDDLAKMYADADLGLVFSTTNPSLVPYEMMACGLPIVDLDRPGNETNYGGRKDIALLANPDPAAMAKRISDLLSDPEELSARSQRGLEFVQTFPSEEEMARRVEELILARMSEKKTALQAAGS